MLIRHSAFLSLLGILLTSSYAQAADGGQTVAEHARNLLKERLEKNPVAISAQHATLKKFYANRNYTLAWSTSSGENAVCTSELAQAIKNAEADGLDAKDYAAFIERFETTTASSQDPAALIERDVALSEAALRYISDLGGARLNPKSINKELFINPDPINAPEALIKGVESTDCGWIAALAPQTKAYPALKSALAELRQRQETKQQQPPLILHKGEKLELGEQNDRIQVLKVRLAQEGYLSEEAAKIAAYDQATVDAVKQFQNEHGIEPDGVVGPATAERLNQTVADRIKQVIVSMERQRWLPRHMGDRYVLVNIAGFYLEAFEQGQKALTMRVIIGQKYRHTPVFSSVINQVRFNPPWDVPAGIFYKDKLPKIKRDPNFIARSNFIVRDSAGNRVDPASVDWANEGGSYRLTQLPGDKNALGKVRMNIINPFDVYMHGTPDQKLFDKAVRNFSSGCIRLEHPEDVAVFVLNDPINWPKEEVLRQMEGTTTRNVNLKNPVNVHITYSTVWIDDAGKMHVVPDIYGQDQQIWQALQERGTKSTGTSS